MAIDVEAVRHWPFTEVRQAYTEKDSILYALALGYGSDPVDEGQLSFVYERNLQASPAMATALCHPGFWISEPRTGIDASRSVHAEHNVVFHKPLPASGTLVATTRVLDVFDRGDGKGAMLVFARDLRDASSGECIASIEHRTLCRADGGFSGAAPYLQGLKPGVLFSPVDISRAPNHAIEITSLPQAALIYRLSADPNPLHADPDVANRAGFPRPILHGLCTYGLVCRAVLETCCEQRADRLRSLAMRFIAPVYPGEVLRVEIWAGEDIGNVGFNCVIPGRDRLLVATGSATLAA
ncbi:MAG: 3-alpha,7-alpha,12-alpha-trihydroxy-5-beta-cholest-24-enoyl-CoA hydratase [Comamonadaceae bacterium]|nr:MAG: 3-alpha,7-alpha,12-alpha-trihydroxy-5-beta-cholest-24-enoyl-CoA hydratase [Comamonadaceae bacterium]